MKNEIDSLFKRFKDAENKKGVVWYYYYCDENEKRISQSIGHQVCMIRLNTLKFI